MTSEWKPNPILKSNGPMSIVRLNVFCSAMAVTMPGSAIGSTIRNEIVFCAEEREPLERERGQRAEHERDAVATSATLTELHQRVAGAVGVPRLLPPLGGPALRAATTATSPC